MAREQAGVDEAAQGDAPHMRERAARARVTRAGGSGSIRTPFTWARSKASDASHQQTFIEACSKVACAKLYTTKVPLVAADLLNERVLPIYEESGMRLLRVLTDRGTEYCGNPEQHPCQIYLAINDIDHTKTKAKSPQANWICERFHKTFLKEFYQITFRKKLYQSIETLQKELDKWLAYYNRERTHQGKMCCGRTPWQTWLDAIPLWKQKIDSLNQQPPTTSN